MAFVIFSVELSERAKKELRKVPTFIAVKLQDWIEDVEDRGLEEVRKIPGYHDEPCKGEMRGFRSIRLSRGYRAYYTIQKSKIEFVRIERVDKHEY